MRKIICLFVCLFCLFGILGCSNYATKDKFDIEVNKFIEKNFKVDVFIDNVEKTHNGKEYSCHIEDPFILDFVISVSSSSSLFSKTIEVSEAGFLKSFEFWQNEMYSKFTTTNIPDEEIIKYVLECNKAGENFFHIISNFSTCPSIRYHFLEDQFVYIYYSINHEENYTREKIHHLFFGRTITLPNEIEDNENTESTETTTSQTTPAPIEEQANYYMNNMLVNYGI